MIPRRFRRLFSLGLHREADAVRDVDAEAQAHVEMRAEQLMSEGWTRDAARAEAERRFASSAESRRSLEQAASHREGTLRMRDRVESVLQDLRYVMRGIRRSPGFAITVATTLALGLGANAALFSVLDRMFLQAPAGVRDAGMVRRLYWRGVAPSNRQSGVATPTAVRTVYSYPMLREIQRALPEGATLVGYRTTTRTPLTVDEAGPSGVLTFVVGDYFGMLGTAFAAGRPFSPEEYRAEGLSQVVVLSYDLAVARFGTPQAAIGQRADIALNPYTVIGVTAKGFRGTDMDASDAWAPMNSRGSWKRQNTGWLTSTGTSFIGALVRAPDEPTFARVRTAAAMAIFTNPTFKRDSARLVLLGSLREAVSPSFQADEQRIATRLGAVALIILVIACANVANILLSRAVTRRREIAVRLALGVSRARLVRQLVTESVVLAAIAGTAAVVVAVVAATALRSTLFPSTQWGAPAIGWRAVIFAAGSAIAAGLAAGLIPALHASRPRLASDLRGGAREGTNRHSRIRSGLLIAQVTLSVLLLTGAGLFVRSLREVQAIDLGYDTDRIVFAELRAGRESGISHQQVSDALQASLVGIERAPNVESVAFTQNVPMWAFSFVPHFLPDRDSVPPIPGSNTIVSFVSPKYFATMGMRVLKGRDFTDADRVGAEPVIIMNTAMAETLWPNENPLGKCMILHKREGACRRVVGVVSEAHYGDVIEKRSMQFYVPLLQEGDDAGPSLTGVLEVRASEGHTSAVVEAVKLEIERHAPPGARPSLRTFTDMIAPQFRTWRIGAQLFSLAGLLALVVAVVGIYGNVSYTLSQRTQEMGVRIALGAQARDIVRMVLREELRVIVIGVLTGLALTFATGKLIVSMLYGVKPNDPAVLAGVAVILVVAAVVAALGPARRATRVDPIESLRTE